jgi:hypothetical protein
MRFNRIPALVLASTTALLVGGIAAPAMAMTPVSELKDVSPDHWAYNAIQTLVEKYQVMEGFPDRTFRGNKTLTRYEMAAALAKVMARVEERIAIATGQPVNVDPGVNPEDLRTIARLQREFREELDALKSRVDTMDSRLTSLEKRVKITGSVTADYRDYTGAARIASEPSADFRVSNRLNADAQLMDDLTVSSTLQTDIYPPQSQGNAFLRGTSANPVTDIYVPRSLITYTPGWINYSAGVGALRDTMSIGSTLRDPFKEGMWREGTGGYGFVGTPGMNNGASAVTTIPTGNGAPGAPAWLPGTNVIVDVVDANNDFSYGPNGDLLSAANVAVGPLKVGLAFDRGAITGKTVLSGNPGLPASLPGFRNWQAGSQGLLTLGLDLGFARLNTLAYTPTMTSTSSPSLRDKMLGASLDIGSDALSLTGEVIGQSSFAFSDYQATKASARLAAMNLMDTGIGLGVGMVTGDPAITPALGAQAPQLGSLFSGAASYTSLGVMLKTPAIFVVPSFTVAAQNTIGTLGAAGFSGNAIGSGLTLGTSFQLFGLPTLNAEYSLGKFNQGVDNTLWSNSPWSIEQIGISTNLKF